MSHRIFVASSWRNEYFPVVVQTRAQLSHPMAVKQLANDLDALRWCDTCVLVLPCGRSAHTEAGWLAGQGKRVVVYIPEAQEPELMYGLFDAIACDMTELLAALAGEDAETNRRTGTSPGHYSAIASETLKCFEEAICSKDHARGP